MLLVVQQIPMVHSSAYRFVDTSDQNAAIVRWRSLKIVLIKVDHLVCSKHDCEAAACEPLVISGSIRKPKQLLLAPVQAAAGGRAAFSQGSTCCHSGWHHGCCARGYWAGGVGNGRFACP
jgi:hypothetical protein